MGLEKCYACLDVGYLSQYCKVQMVRCPKCWKHSEEDGTTRLNH
jgi:hypothetical protein